MTNVNPIQEEWKAIKNYEGIYEVSNYGRVRSIDRYTTFIRRGKVTRRFTRGKLCCTPMNNCGYLTVLLFEDGQGKGYSVHRLVAQAFLPDYSEELDVDHIDNKRNNNRIWNLQMLTHSANMNKRDLSQLIAGSVEKLDKDGNIICHYFSIKSAALDNNMSRQKLISHLAYNKPIRSKYLYRFSA